MKKEKFKIGDQLYVTSSKNCGNKLDGKVVVITAAYSGYYVVSYEGMQYNLYASGPSDEFVLATKENIVDVLKEKISELKEQIGEVEKELDFRTKYASEEEYLAEKFENMLKTPTKENIGQILKDMRKMNHL